MKTKNKQMTYVNLSEYLRLKCESGTYAYFTPSGIVLVSNLMAITVINNEVHTQRFTKLPTEADMKKWIESINEEQSA